MGAEWWLLLGLGAAPLLLVVGWWARRYEVRYWTHRFEITLAELEQALEQGEAGVEAARLQIRTERKIAEALASGSPRARHRLLLDGTGSETPPTGGETGVVGGEPGPVDVSG